MWKKLIWLGALAAALFAGGRLAYPFALKHFFRCTGTVNVAAPLLRSLPGPNSMLFVVAVNDNGVPVAVQKILNPVFPAPFSLTAANLIMPDLLTGRLYLQAQLTTRGGLGEFLPGDMEGSRPECVPVRSAGVEITLDQSAR